MSEETNEITGWLRLEDGSEHDYLFAWHPAMADTDAEAFENGDLYLDGDISAAAGGFATLATSEILRGDDLPFSIEGCRGNWRAANTN